MFKLRQNGIEGKLLEWLNCYLSQRKQKREYISKKGGKDQLSIQSSTTPDPGYDI